MAKILEFEIYISFFIEKYNTPKALSVYPLRLQEYQMKKIEAYHKKHLINFIIKKLLIKREV